MVLHTPQNVVEYTDCRYYMRSLVEHHALRALSHRRVSDLGPGRLTFFGERLEDLRCPDDGQMCRLTDPQDFLLNFRQSFVATHSTARSPRAIMIPTGCCLIAASISPGKRSKLWRVSIFSTIPK